MGICREHVNRYVLKNIGQHSPELLVQTIHCSDCSFESKKMPNRYLPSLILVTLQNMLLEIDSYILYYIQRCQRHLIQSYSCLLVVGNPGPSDGMFSYLLKQQQYQVYFHKLFECLDMYLRVCQFLLFLLLQSNKMFVVNILVIRLKIICWHQFGKSK